jgi:hypothetical protein
MVIIRRADHAHFEDDVERRHEEVRAMAFPEFLSWLPSEMLPIASLISGDQAHLAIRGLTVAHFDSTLKSHEGAAELLGGDVAAALTRRGVEVDVRRN